MKAPTLRRLLLSLAFLILGSGMALSQHLRLQFQEVVQTADLIFIGTVERQVNHVNNSNTMAFTDVIFKDIEIIHATDGAAQKNSPGVKLTYAGGRLGDTTISLSHAPAFEGGRRYLVFMRDDAKTYANPLIGADQGMFQVIKDSSTSQEYVLTAGGKAVTGIDSAGITTSEAQVSAISNGVIIGDDRRESASSKLHSTAPAPRGPGVER